MEGWKEGGREGQREREQREIAGAHASARVREQYFYLDLLMIYRQFLC